MFAVKTSSSAGELAAILQLRYKLLREPWGKAIESATDQLEASSVNAYISDEQGQVIACGRLQENDDKTGQIRFMAVDTAHQGKGLGKKIVSFLEEKARFAGMQKIELQARENAVLFYKDCGYSIEEKSFLLWGLIQHYRMVKTLS